jgi:hypothetical protein
MRILHAQSFPTRGSSSICMQISSQGAMIWQLRVRGRENSRTRATVTQGNAAYQTTLDAFNGQKWSKKDDF